MKRENRLVGLLAGLKSYEDDLLDQCDSMMATNESFRRRILRLAEHHGKGKRGTLRLNIHPMQLQAEFRLAEKKLRKELGPMRRITKKQMAELLIASFPHHKGKQPGWLVKQLPR